MLAMPVSRRKSDLEWLSLQGDIPAVGEPLSDLPT